MMSKKLLSVLVVTVLCWAVLAFGVAGALSDGLVHYYTYDDDDTSGGVLSDLVGDKDGYQVGSPTTGVTGQVGEAYDFAFSAYMNFSDVDLPDSWTISGWIEADSGSSDFAVFNKDDVSTRNYRLYASTGFQKVSARTWRASGDCEVENVGPDVIDGNWHLLTATFDNASNTLTVYVDNESVGSDNTCSGGQVNGDIDVTSVKQISVYGTGKIDEVGIWDRALSLSEVQEFWNDSNGMRPAFDANPPDLYFEPSVNVSVLNNSAIGVNLSCVDDFNLSQCYFNVTSPGAVTTQYVPNQTITFDELGVWSVLFYGDDGSGKSNSEVIEVLSDLPPSLSVSFPVEISKGNDDTVFLSCLDLGGNLDECYFNVTAPDSSVVQYVPNSSVTFDQLGNYSILFFADDLGGFVTSQVNVTQSWYVDWDAVAPLDGEHVANENLTFNYSYSNSLESVRECTLFVDDVDEGAVNCSIDTVCSNSVLGLSDGAISVYIGCDGEGNSSAKSIVVDTAEPVLSYNPENTSFIEFNVSTVWVNCTDDNLFGCGLAIINPSGVTVYDNFTTNLSGSEHYHSVVFNWSVVGTYVVHFNASDDHNKLKSKHLIDKVKSWEQIVLVDGVEFDTFKQKIKVTAPYESVESVVATFNDETTNYNLDWDFAESKKVRTYRVVCEEFAYYRADSGYSGHIVCGDSYYDTEQEGEKESVSVVRVDDFTFEVTVTSKNAADKIKQKSLGGLNQNSRVSFVEVNSSCVPDWACSGYGDCNASGLQVCDTVTDNNACGVSYTGDYSEFSAQSCVPGYDELYDSGETAEVVIDGLIKFGVALVSLSGLIGLMLLYLWARRKLRRK